MLPGRRNYFRPYESGLLGSKFATRIPKDLHRRLKLHCVTQEIAVMHFIVEAIEEKLGRKTRAKKRTA